MGKVVYALEIVSLGLVAKFLVVLANPAGVRVDIKKLEAKQAFEDFMNGAAVLIAVNRGFDDLDNSGFVPDPDAPAVFDRVVKFIQLAGAPFAA